MAKRGPKPKAKKITVHLDVLDDAQAITFEGRSIDDPDWLLQFEWLQFERVDGTTMAFNPRYVVYVEIGR